MNATVKMAEEQRPRCSVDRGDKKAEQEGEKMKRLSMLAALSAVLVSGFISNAAQAQVLTGGVFTQDLGRREFPAGVYETGRYARFIMDSRLSDLNLKNRDFEAWKPLDVRSKNMMRHFMFGRLQTSDSPVPDQEIGRYVRVLEDDRLEANNMEFNDRTFYPYQQPSPYTAEARSAMAKSYLRGLPVGTNIAPSLGAKYLSGAPRLLYFWQ